MKLVEIKGNIKIGAFIYKLIERNGGKIVGHVQSSCSMDTGTDYHDTDTILGRYPCIYIDNDCLRFSKLLTDSLNYEYDTITGGGVSELVKREGFYGEVIHKWSANRDLTKSYHLINDLLAWDEMPIGAKDKGTFEAIRKAHPDFTLTQSDLRSSCSSFKYRGDTYTFVYKGYVLDANYGVIKPQKDSMGIYFTIGGTRVTLEHILTYNILNLRL